jgi:hypothetical protein
MKRLSFILISVLMLGLITSCNYIPFPCNFFPSRNSDFNIDPIERDDNSFEILRDTIISQKNYLNDDDLGFNDNISIEEPQLSDLKICYYNKDLFSNNVFVNSSTNKEPGNKIKSLSAKKVIYSIQPLDSSVAGVDSFQQPQVVKVRKQVVTITKTIEHS